MTFQNPPTPLERRQSPRIPLVVPVRIYGPNDSPSLEDPVLVATSRNLSASGLYLHTFHDSVFAPMSVVRLRITAPMAAPSDSSFDIDSSVSIASDLAAFFDLENHYCALESKARIVRIESIHKETMLGSGLALRFDRPLSFA